MTYRPYIDGLRAVAVLSVIMFHFGFRAFAGGFLGVDVFFVLSGFLITQVLAASANRSLRERALAFYVRRARRLLPAFLGTSLFVAAAAFFIDLPDDLTRLGSSLVLAPVFLSNLASLHDGGYFARGGFFPLNHYWSLAVEEQFYLAYPALLWVIGIQKRSRWCWVLTLIVVASFGICIRGAHLQSSSIFYLMPARAWELMLGALMASLPAIDAPRRWLSELLAAAFAGTILLAILTFNSKDALPNPHSAIPSLACALLLYLSQLHATWVTRALSWRPLVFTGKISYSLYLWHAPLIAFVQYYLIRPLTPLEYAALFAAIYAVAAASWRVLELPIRHRRVLRSNRAFMSATVAASLGIFALGVWYRDGAGLSWRFSPAVRALARPDDLMRDARFCLTETTEHVRQGALCTYGASEGPTTPRVVVWGDSHALVLLPALRALADEHHFRLYYAFRSSCRPIYGASNTWATEPAQRECVEFNAAMADEIRRIRPSVTVISAFWSLDKTYMSETYRETLPPNTRMAGWDWGRTLLPVRDVGSSTCIVLDVPTFAYAVPYALAMARRRGLDESFLNVTRAEVDARYRDFEKTVRSLTGDDSITVVDPKDTLCPSGQCPAVLDNRPLYRDSNHLSQFGAARLQTSLESCFINGRAAVARTH